MFRFATVTATGARPTAWIDGWIGIGSAAPGGMNRVIRPRVTSCHAGPPSPGPALARAAALVACGAVAGTAACRRPADAPDVAFLLATLDGRYAEDVLHFERRAEAHGLDVVTAAAGGDPERQVAQVEDALARGVKVLVIDPADAVAASSYVRLAHARGAKVVAYDRAIMSPNLDFYVSHDSYRVGVLQAEAALAATGGKGRYVLLAGDPDHTAAAAITRGYDDTLAGYVARGDVLVVTRRHHEGGAPDDARRTVDEALAAGPVDAILANTSGLARGAVQAVDAAEAAGVFIAGADADPPNVNYVCQGRQALEVLKAVAPLAEAAADVAHRLARGDAPPATTTVALAGADVPVATVRVDVVTAENVKPLLVDTGVLSAADLPACAGQLAVAAP